MAFLPKAAQAAVVLGGSSEDRKVNEEMYTVRVYKTENQCPAQEAGSWGEYVRDIALCLIYSDIPS